MYVGRWKRPSPVDVILGFGALGRFSRFTSDNQSEENPRCVGTFILSLTYFVSCSLWKRTWALIHE